jgi:signal transduction histidine kinase
MNPDAKEPRLERDKTDDSLRTERKNSDEVLTERRAGIEENADVRVERARAQADAVLEAARGKADHLLGDAGPESQGQGTVAQEREREDAIIEHERSLADERLRRERAEHARVLATLLPLERERTDRHLQTERTRADDAIAHRDDFLGMVSHDLRNLLSGMVLNATLLAEDASDTEEGRRTVIGMQRIQRDVGRMNRLIGDLVDVASIDAGKLAVHLARGDAAALIQEVLETFARVASNKGLSLEVADLEPALPADFDHDRMLQVLANLVGNALKFTPAGGAIVLRGALVDDELRLSVSDTGAGIPAHLLDAVFERFWQVGKNDKRGLGLGLHISRCIVDAHGGKIWAESTLGAGSVFHVTIPATAARAG